MASRATRFRDNLPRAIRIGRKYREIQLSSCLCNSSDPIPLLFPPPCVPFSRSALTAAACERSLPPVCKIKKKNRLYHGVVTAINKYSRGVSAFFSLSPLFTLVFARASSENSRLSVFHELLMSQHLDRAWPSEIQRKSSRRSTLSSLFFL